MRRIVEILLQAGISPFSVIPRREERPTGDPLARDIEQGGTASLYEGGERRVSVGRKEWLKIADLNNSNSFRLLRIRSAASSLNEGAFLSAGGFLRSTPFR